MLIMQRVHIYNNLSSCAGLMLNKKKVYSLSLWDMCTMLEMESFYIIEAYTQCWTKEEYIKHHKNDKIHDQIVCHYSMSNLCM
jgi:hypothetical protein